MEVVACPTCGQANSLPVGLHPAQARCASCDGSLEGPPPRYFIAQDQDVQGPFERALVLQLIQRGKVRPEMMFCEEGTDDWVAGRDCPDFFPHLAPPVARTPAPYAQALHEPEPLYEVPGDPAPVPRALRHDVEHVQHAHHKLPPPGGVVFAAVLDFLNAIICIWFVVLVIQLMYAIAAVTDGKFDRSPLIGLMLAGAALAVGYVVVGLLLLRGSQGGRVTQYVLSGIGALLALVRLVRVGPDARLTPGVSLALAVIVIVLISTPAASEFFAGSTQRGGHRGGRGGGYRPRRRPRRRRRY